MKVIVVGCGRVGAGLAGGLDDAGHEVAVIDRDRTAFERLPIGFGGRRIAGVGFDRDHLEDAGIAGADAVAAVTSGDNSNILVARIARETYGVERVVARIYDTRRAEIYERLDIPTIATVAWTRERVLRRILPDLPAVDWLDPSARIALVERPVEAAWIGRSVAETERSGVLRIAAVTRRGQALLPTADLLLQEGDVLHLTVESGSVDRLDELLTGPILEKGR